MFVNLYYGISCRGGGYIAIVFGTFETLRAINRIKNFASGFTTGVKIDGVDEKLPANPIDWEATIDKWASKGHYV